MKGNNRNGHQHPNICECNNCASVGSSTYMQSNTKPYYTNGENRNIKNHQIDGRISICKYYLAFLLSIEAISLSVATGASEG